MKRLWVPMFLMMWLGTAAWGAGPNEEYVHVYSLIQQGAAFEQSNRRTEALALYLDAEKRLTQLKRANPSWNTKVVDFRLRFLRAKIAGLTPAVPAEDPAAAAPQGLVDSADPAAVQTRLDTLTAEKTALQRDVETLQSANATLQAQLREALAVRPAAADPRKLEEAEERNRALTKQVEVLRLRLAERERQDGAAAEATAGEATEAGVQRERERLEELEAERAALAAQVASLAGAAEQRDALVQENALLKQQLAEIQAAAKTDEATQQYLDEAVTELALMISEVSLLRLERSALEERLLALQERVGETASTASAELEQSRARNAQLQEQVGHLRDQLSQAGQDRSEGAVVTVGEPSGQTEAQIERLEARLAVYESEKVPYSPEELALFRMSRGMESSEASRPAPPSGVGPLVAQAERQFREGDFQEAEATLTEVLAADEANAFTLANLAAVQMEQGKEAEAEANLRKALAIAPREPFTLATLGMLKFEQEEYVDALDYLGLAAQYNPDSAVIHNYLGMALSEQGMRGPAETALRRAIQLQPGFSDAHFNLALVYILQEPPLRELARWHYQKALGTGHSRSTRLEQLLDQASTR